MKTKLTILIILLILALPITYIIGSSGSGWSGDKYEYMIIKEGIDYAYSVEYGAFSSRSGYIQLMLPTMIADVDVLVNGDKEVAILSGFYNIAGDDGWELVSNENGIFVFKRHKK